MKKMNILRGIALLLAAIMIFTSVPEVAYAAAADSSIIEENVEAPAAEETVVEQAGTVEETQVTTPEVVEPETTDEIQVNAAAPETTDEVVEPVEAAPEATDEVQPVEAAPEVQEEEVENIGVAATDPRILTPSTTNFSGSYSYGTEVKAVTIATIKSDVDAEYQKKTGNYEDFTAYLMDADESVSAQITAEGVDLSSVNSYYYAGNLKVYVDKNAIKIAGTPMQYMPSTVYKIQVVDNNSGGTAALGDADGCEITATIQVAGANAAISAGSYAFNTTQYDHSTNVRAGYGVGDTSPTEEKDWVVPQNVTVESTISKEALAVGDLKAVVAKTSALTGESGPYTGMKLVEEALANETGHYSVKLASDNTSLYASHDVEFTLNPVEGLKSDGGQTTNYNETLVVYSESGAIEPIKKAVTFTVTSDLALTAKQGNETNPENFVGKVDVELDPIVITLKGGVAPYQSIITKTKDTPSDTEKPDWISESVDLSSGTLTLGGEPADVETTHLNIIATDYAGATTHLYVDIDSTKPSLEFKVGEEEVTSAYNWWINSEEDLDAGMKTLTITNPTSKAVTSALTVPSGFNVEADEEVYVDTEADMDENPDSIVVPAKSSVAINITPTAPSASDDLVFAVANPGNTDAATITLTFNKLGEKNVVISSPATAGTEIPAKKVGESLSYPFSVTGYTGDTHKWSLVSSAASLDGSTGGSSGVAAATLKNTYGITIDEQTGILSADKLLAPSSGALTIYVRYEAFEGESTAAETSYVRSVSFTVNDADAESLAIIDSDGELVEDDYPMGGGYELVDSSSSRRTILTLVNNTGVDVTGLDVSGLAATKDGGNITAGDFFVVSVKDNATSIKAGESVDLIFEKKGSATFTAGHYELELTVATAQVEDVKVKLYLDVIAKPTLTYVKWSTKTPEELTLGDSKTYVQQDPVENGYVKISSNPDKHEIVYSAENLPAGMKINSATGQIYGTPTAAFEGTVRFYGYDTVTGITSEVCYVPMVVPAPVTLKSITLKEGEKTATGDARDKVYIYDGVSIGADAPAPLTVTVNNSASAAISQPLTISIEDFSEGAYTNAFKGSKDHFRLSKTNITTLPKSGSTTFTITPYGTAAADDYAVKVTIKGNELEDQSFYVYWAVTGNFRMTALGEEFAGKVGDDSFGEYVAAAYGAGRYQTVEIKESLSTGVKTNIPDGLGLEFGNEFESGGKPYSVPGNNSVAWLGVDDDDPNTTNFGGSYESYPGHYGTPKKAGVYTVSLKASAKASTAKFNPISDVITNIANATSFITYPALEETEPVSFTVNIEPGSALIIKQLTAGTGETANGSSVTVGTSTQTNMRAANYFDDTYVVDPTDPDSATNYQNTFVTFENSDDKYVAGLYGYVFDNLTYGYSDGNSITVNVLNTSTVADLTATAYLEKGENFTLTTKTNATKKTQALTAANMASGTLAPITVKANKGLAVGTYEDRLVVESAGAETIYFDVFVTVEAEDYAIDITYEDSYKLDTDGSPLENTIVEEARASVTTENRIKVYTLAGANADDLNGSLHATIANSGNKSTTVTVAEVKEDGSAITKNADKLLKLGLTDSSMGYTYGQQIASGYKDLYIAPASNSQATGTTYLKFTFTTTKDKSESIIVPVDLVVYKAGVAGKPTLTNELTVANVIEGYSADSATGTFTIETDNFEEYTIGSTEHNAADETDNLYMVTAAFKNASDDHEKFSIVCDDANELPEGKYGFYQIAPGVSKAFKVVPEEKLPAGTYTYTLVVSAFNADMDSDAANVQLTKEYDVNFVVAPNNEVGVEVDAFVKKAVGNVYTTGIPDNKIGSESIATRLYNTFAVMLRGDAGDDDPSTSSIDESKIYELKAPSGASGEVIGSIDANAIDVNGGKVVVTLNDGFVMEFPVTTATTAKDITTVSVIDAANATIVATTAKAPVQIDTGLAAAATAGEIGGTSGLGHYVNDITFNPYYWVALDADYESLGAKFVLTKKAFDDLGIANDGSLEADHPQTVYALVKGGDNLSTVFEELPAVVKDGSTMNGWTIAGDTDTPVNANYKITQEIIIAPDMTEHTYGSDDSGETYVSNGDTYKWTWSEDGTSVSLTLDCVASKHTDSITYTGKYGYADAGIGTENRIAVTRYATEPTADIGSGYRYEATITVGTNTYTDQYYVGDPEGATGHTWDYHATIEMVDGKPVVTEAYAQSRETGKKVTINTKVTSNTVKGNCETPTTITYSVQGYKLNKSGVSTSELTDDLDFCVETIPALGHTFKDLYADYKVDESGAIVDVARVYSLCDVCGDEIVFTDYEKTVADGKITVTAKYGSKTLTTESVLTVADSATTITAPTADDWTWNEDFTRAYVTVKRTVSKTQSDNKTYSMNSTPAVTITKTVGQVYDVYTASITLTDKKGTVTYTDTVKDTSRWNNDISDEGTEDGYIEVLWYNENWDNEDEHLTYTGVALKPQVSVINGSKILVEGTDYTVSYKNNKNAGVASVIVKGKGNYTGQNVSKTFTIDKKNIGDDDVYVGNASVLNGKKVTPILTYAGIQIPKASLDLSAFSAKITGTDFDEGIAVVEKTIKVSSKGSKNFEGEKEVYVTVVQNKSQLVPIKATLAKGISFVYDGTAKTLNADHEDADCNLWVQPKKGSTGYLNYGDDFDVTYSANVNAGTVKVVITGKGIYTGKVTKSFKITPAKGNVIKCTNADGLSAEYRSTGAQPTIELVDETLDNRPLWIGKDYKLSFKKNKAVGTATAVVTFIGNYKGAGTKGKLEVPFQVTPALLSADNTVVSVPEQIVYTEKAAKKIKNFTPDPYVMLVNEGADLSEANRGTLLKKNTDYTVTYMVGETALPTKGAFAYAPTSEAPVEVTAVITIAPKAAGKYKVEDGGLTISKTYEVVLPKGQDLTGYKAVVVQGAGSTKTAKIGYTGEPITFGDDLAQGVIALKKGKTYIYLTGENADKFDVTYVNNTKKGTATIIVTPNTDEYTGSVKGSFKIKAGSIFGIKR